MSKKRKKYQALEPRHLTLDIEEPSFLGEGIAHDGDAPVFVPYTIPGEQVEATIWRKSRRFLEAHLDKVVKESPHRIKPKCPYYGACTGCQWQHISYEHQLTMKTQLVREQLERVGEFDQPTVQPTIGCDDPWGYRNHARFTVNPEGQLGFVNSIHRRFVRIDKCLIMDDGINHLLRALQEKAQETTQISIRYAPKLDSWLIQPTLQSPDIAVDSGQTHYQEELMGHRFRVASSSFFQVNMRQAERLVALVKDALDLGPDDTLLDAYAGVGTFAALLAPSAREVIAVEESKSAIKDAEHNIQGLNNVRLVEAKTEDALAAMERTPDALILDPPRAGCHPRVLDALTKSRPPKVAYVSCDPATLARDLKHLTAEAYELGQVQPLDMFPHTHHVESVALLRSLP